MAANHSTLATIARCISGVPRIVVPDIGVTETESGRLAFTVQTPFEPISIEASGCEHNTFWRCRGSAESLAAHGLLRLDWLPGLPGNNKTSQTVFFGGDGPELFRGNRRGGKFFDVEFITIKRVSSATYAVEVPATAEQTRDIKAAAAAWLDRCVNERQARAREQENERQARAREQEKLRGLTIPAHEVKAEILRMVSACENLVAARLEWGAYRFDTATDRGLGEHFGRLRSWIEQATLQESGPEALGGNVTRLHRKR